MRRGRYEEAFSKLRATPFVPAVATASDWACLHVQPSVTAGREIVEFMLDVEPANAVDELIVLRHDARNVDIFLGGGGGGGGGGGSSFSAFGSAASGSAAAPPAARIHAPTATAPPAMPVPAAAAAAVRRGARGKAAASVRSADAPIVVPTVKVAGASDPRYALHTSLSVGRCARVLLSICPAIYLRLPLSMYLSIFSQ